ncbi:alpha/beta hydrolase [Sphingomonas sp.]|uniref:alpha/beta fold hydrolase n=1 Tax=Sphingomonas sp. TaxID=28214 RepID=UPI0025DF9340|nr:alpha/beta hydrolase [Sphingomonas sp.]
MVDRSVVMTRRQTLGAGIATMAIMGRLSAALPSPRESWIDVGEASLYVRDSGGTGIPVLLAHPVTGSALVWEAQEAHYASAGYRVISWSRRDHARSRTETFRSEPDQTADLLRIVDALKLNRFHALGSAAGGGVVLDFAVAHPDRILSLVIANHIGNMADPVFRRRYDALRPAPFSQLPASFRELGPIYRAANPDGVARWEELERTSRTAPLGPQPRGTLEWEQLGRLTMPSLWITGDADSYAPPPLFDEHRRRLSKGRFFVIPGAGHSAYWEFPDMFDKHVLDFWRSRA